MKKRVTLFLTAFLLVLCVNAAPAMAKTQTYTAKLYTYQGVLWRTIKVDDETVFPAQSFEEGRTFQGWSTKKGQRKGAIYKEQQKIPKKNASYYAVVSRPSLEKAVGSLKEPGKYEKIYFVGDSRTEHLKNYFGKQMERTKFISESYKGYEWFIRRGGGYDQLISALKKAKKTKKKNAVIFCLGVNDLHNIDDYIAFYKSKASELKKQNCDLFVMSVNPFSPKQRSRFKLKNTPGYEEKRTLSLVNTFNNKLKNELGGKYRYLDVNSYLYKIGFCYKAGSNKVPDGLHYTKTTYRNILSYTFSLIA